jgi:hypothetical protein
MMLLVAAFAASVICHDYKNIAVTNTLNLKNPAALRAEAKLTIKALRNEPSPYTLAFDLPLNMYQIT